MIFDGHSDIFSDVRYKREAGETQVLKNHHLERLQKGGIGGACFVIWADTFNGFDPKDEMDAIVKALQAEMAETEDFVLVHNRAEVEAAEKAGKFAILLGIEGLAGIGEDLSKIDALYEVGARHAMLTWNEENALATGVKGSPDRGVTDLGRKAIKKIQDKKMILDVSHLNEKSFWDVIDASNGPILASHSNAKALAGAARNLTDDQLKAIRDTNGLVGLNAFNDFISDIREEQDVDHLVNHASYIADKIGVEHLGFGFDFFEFLNTDFMKSYSDQDDSLLRGMEDCSKVPVLLEKMRKAGFTEKDLEMISGGNWLNLIQRVMG
ncbi:MAG: membrane dipeptidase [Bacteroidales bacterium]|nr:membrane dipeptidase [Anaerotignum sp.]MCI5678520.1 membrane dipeptidase [Bacteroidales bacterium]MDY3926365.1 membrane dipeptidase [Anaerotignum sp.]